MAPSTAFVERPRDGLRSVDAVKSTFQPAADIQALLSIARQRFTERNPNSLRFHEESLKSLPGGNTRTLLHTTPFPIFMKSGKGYQLTDEDGHTYTDFVAEMTAGLYGHSNELIQKVIIKTMQDTGLNLGGTTKLEAQYATLLCERFSLDRIRFCNSGTEANLHALAGARRYTGKRKIVVFADGYHGAVLGFAGGKPGGNNVDLDDWIIVPYNDIEATVAAIKAEGVAAVIVEGMQGAGGAIPGKKEFLHAIQQASKKSKVLFILDEVMTSRVAPGGLAETLGLEPDLKTFGKYLGSGLAFGAFGGKEEVMRVFDPREPGAVSHSGTFNNNTLVMAAGYAGLSQVFTSAACTELNKLGVWMLDQLDDACKGSKLSFTGVGTILCAHFTSDGTREILRGSDVSSDWDLDLKDLLWMEMIEEGFWITRRGSIALILHTPKAEIERFVAAIGRFLVKYHDSVHL